MCFGFRFEANLSFLEIKVFKIWLCFRQLVNEFRNVVHRKLTVCCWIFEIVSTMSTTSSQALNINIERAITEPPKSSGNIKYTYCGFSEYIISLLLTLYYWAV